MAVDLLRRLAVGVLAVAMIAGCDVIEGDPAERPNGPDTSGPGVPRVVLLEDFTGHLCGNCPEATDIAKQITEAYGEDRVIVVGIHVGPLAVPAPPDYPEDFTTAEGNELDRSFRISTLGIPNGFVNRITRNGKMIIGKGVWSTAIAEQLATKAVVDLKATAAYDATTRTITVDSKVLYQTAGTTDYNIVALLTENGIIADQIDYRRNPSHIKGYTFNHVLRAGLNGTWGEQLSAVPVAAGDSITKRITYQVPESLSWNPTNSEIIVYVHKHGSSREVLQTTRIPVVPSAEATE